MGKHAQVVMGPAGSGKSTYVNVMRTHCENLKRSVHCVNLDPAADHFEYPVSLDIRDIITVDEVMEETPWGPNGGLIFSMEFFMQNLEVFREQLGDYDDDYLLIDCPGQIELYTHMELMKTFVNSLQEWGYTVCAVYLLDSHFITDSAKYIAGNMMCLSAMIRLELPHVNILSKMDLMDKHQRSELENIDETFINPNMSDLLADLNKTTSKKFHRLNEAIASLIDEYSMVAFLPLDIKDEESINFVLAQIDNALQYGEDLDVQAPDDLMIDPEDFI